MHTVIRRLLGVALPALVAGGALQGCTPAPRVIHSFNLYGNVGWAGALNPAQELVRQVDGASPAPITVSVQEMCATQWSYLKDKLGERGYVAHNYIADAGVTGNCQWGGNGVFTRGGTEYKYEYRFPDQDPSDRIKEEFRGLVCHRTASDYTGCSTHMTPADSWAFLQIDDARNWFNGLNGRRIMAGDFNVNPGTGRQIGDWYFEYLEADDRYNYQATVDNGRDKLDYIFVNRGGVTRVLARAEPVSESDHHYYKGKFEF